MQFAEIGDLDICYQLLGDGYPTVLIQGLAANMDWWDPDLLRHLSQRYRVLAFDSRGAGRTVTPRERDWTVEMFADDTAALMEAVGFERAHIFGVSMGGMVAQELVIKYPQKVAKLVLSSTFCGGDKTVYADGEVYQKMADPSGGLEGALQRTIELMFTPQFITREPEVIEWFRGAWMKAPVTYHNAARQFQATYAFDTYGRLPEIIAPTLLVADASDIIMPPENAGIIAGRIPGARLIIYEGTGHAIIVHATETFRKDLLEFLGS